MHKWMTVWCCLTATIFIGACCPKNMVVLVPDQDGAVGRIRVANAAGSVDIDRANQATIVRDSNAAPTAPTQLDPAEIGQLFGNVLSNLPPPPIHFILNFKSDSTQLLSASTQQLPEIVAEIQRRTPTHISVVGHSDTMGNKAYNLDISMRRALAVKQLLVDEGVDDSFIDVSSHGEENPLVKTADNVANAQNRRVEVIVR